MSILDPEKLHENAQAVTIGKMEQPEGNAGIVEIESSPTTVVGEEASEQTPSVEDNKSNARLCGVCKENEFKYKCSRCYLPYCSISCSTIHNATHPALELSLPPRPKDDVPKTSRYEPRLGTVAAAKFRGPFAVLDDSKELQELFKQFPDLPSQLEDINTATLRPLDDCGPQFGQGNGRGPKEAWNLERGLLKGVKALHEARAVYGKDGEGVREFGRLILQILSREDTTNAAADLVQRELAEENARIVQQILNGELQIS